jgi:hypothetical protein
LPAISVKFCGAPLLCSVTATFVPFVMSSNRVSRQLTNENLRTLMPMTEAIPGAALNVMQFATMSA